MQTAKIVNRSFITCFIIIENLYPKGVKFHSLHRIITDKV
jgi:hypothetical protein